MKSDAVQGGSTGGVLVAPETGRKEASEEDVAFPEDRENEPTWEVLKIKQTSAPVCGAARLTASPELPTKKASATKRHRACREATASPVLGGTCPAERRAGRWAGGCFFWMANQNTHRFSSFLLWRKDFSPRFAETVFELRTCPICSTLGHSHLVRVFLLCKGAAAFG